MTVSIDRTAPLRAAIYCRISQDRSGEGLGVERQQEKCLALAETEGWEVVGIYVDDNVSAYSGSVRPKFDELLGDIEAGKIDAVLAWHVDRLYRGFNDLERIVKVIRKTKVVVRTVMAGDVDLSTAAGVLIAEVFTSISKHESAQKGERIRAKHAQSARMGLAHGGMRPYGYERVSNKPGTLAIVDAEAAIIREAATRVLAGESVRAVVLDFQRRDVPTVRGGPWRPKALADILRSPRIAGIRPTGGAPGAAATWPEIVDTAIWRRLTAVLNNPTRGRMPRSYLLAGTLFCGRCGCRLYSASSRNQGVVRRRYHCRPEEPSACGRLSVEAKVVEAYVTGLVFGAAQSADLGQVRSERRSEDQARLAASLDEDERQLNQWAEDAGNRLITRTEYFHVRAPIEERISEAKKGLARLAPDDPIPADMADVLGRWETLSFEQRRAVIALFVSKVSINPAAHHGGRFDPTRVRVEWRA